MAQTWCAAMCHFFQIWQREGGTLYEYTEEDALSWRPPDEFMQLVANLPPAARPQAQSLVHFRPTARR